MFSFCTFLAISFLSFPPLQERATAHSSKSTFTIQVDPSVKIEEVQVKYFMTGDFGGLGGFQVDQNGEHRILIHTEAEGKPAKSLKAVFYAPQCQIQTISVDDLSQSSRESEFHCTPLGNIELQGKFARGPLTPNRRMEVEIQYLGDWSHRFFGIADGFVLTFRIARADAEPDDSFHLSLPNLAETDGSFPQAADASFLVLLRDAESGNVLAELKPPTSLSRAGNLKIMPSYPQAIEFDAEWH